MTFKPCVYNDEYFKLISTHKAAMSWLVHIEMRFVMTTHCTLISHTKQNVVPEMLGNEKQSWFEFTFSCP